MGLTIGFWVAEEDVHDPDDGDDEEHLASRSAQGFLGIRQEALLGWEHTRKYFHPMARKAVLAACRKSKSASAAAHIAADVPFARRWLGKTSL